MASTIIAAIGAFVAIGTLVAAAWEYRVQGRQRRAEHFLRTMERFFADDQFLNICKLLSEEDEAAIARIGWDERFKFLGFVEEIALLVNSKLIPQEIAYYMFGFYSLRASESAAFMKGADLKSQYWEVFREFVSKMSLLEKSHPRAKRFRL